MNRISTVARIVSGGQAGADRAALDCALRVGIPHGGWCPKERRAEDGVIPQRYALQETETENYEERTHFNVRDSDGTLILNIGELDGGSLLTARCCEQLSKPHLVIQLDRDDDAEALENVARWLTANSIRVLNVAGPRESKRPGIYGAASEFLDRLIGGSK